MTRIKRAVKNRKRGAKATPDPVPPVASDPVDPAGRPLPSSLAGTNLIIADVVLRAAGDMLRDRLEKGLLTASYDKTKAERIVDNRSVVASAALWGASRLARRSPVGLVIVAGGLAAKVFYDRGKRIEAKRTARRQKGGRSGNQG